MRLTEVGVWGRGNEKHEVLLDHLKDYWLLKEVFAPWN
jgi:hypothetical protein